MRKMYSLFLGIAFAASTTAYCQTSENETSTDTQEYDENGRLITNNKYALKFDPVKMLVGEFCFGVEYKISKGGSIELELGPTTSGINPFNLSSGDLGNGRANLDPKFGFFGTLGYKYYPIQGALHGMYVEPKVKIREYLADFNYENLQTKLGRSIQSSFFFDFGYQIWLNKSFCADIYTGFGVGTYENKSYSLITQNQGISPNVTTIPSWKENREKDIALKIELGIKLGLGK